MCKIISVQDHNVSEEVATKTANWLQDMGIRLSLSQGPERLLHKAWLMSHKDTTASQGIVIRMAKSEQGYSMESMQVVWTSGAEVSRTVILAVSTNNLRAAICVTPLANRAYELPIQAQHVTPSGLLNLCKGTATYHSCGWVPIDHIVPWKDYKSRIKVQAIFAMAYINEPRYICDRQTLQRVQKEWAPNTNNWDQDSLLQNKIPQLLRHLGELHEALTQGELGKGHEAARSIWKIRSNNVRFLIWHPKGTIMYLDTMHYTDEKLPIPILYNGDRAIFFESIPECSITDDQRDQRRRLLQPGASEGSIAVT